MINNITMSETAYLEVILGCMFSGKSTRLVEIYKQCQFCNISVAVINHSLDNRYDDELLSTHDQIKIPCIKTDKLLDIWSDNIALESNIDLIPCIHTGVNIFTNLAHHSFLESLRLFIE